MLTKEEASKYITYDPETGVFTSCGVKYSNKKEGERVGTLHNTKGYRYIVIKKKTYREQRVAFLMMTGEWPIYQVDHINGNKEDNRWINLRDVSPAVNCQNRGMFKNNTSGHKGVVWNKSVKKWQVLCRANGKQHYLGIYHSLDEASEVAEKFYKTIR